MLDLTRESFSQRINTATVAIMETADEYSVAPTDSAMIIREIAKALDVSPPEERKKLESFKTFSLQTLDIIKRSILQHVQLMDLFGKTAPKIFHF